eukprot:2014649-Pyramimonas_sp.AAC.1
MSIVAKISLCWISTPLGNFVGHLRPIDVLASMATPADVRPPAHLAEEAQSMFQPKLLAVE